MGSQYLLLVPTWVVILVAVFGWLDAPRAAAKRLTKLAKKSGIALDDDTAIVVRTRLRRRGRAMMLGMVAGMLAGNAMVVLAANDFTWFVAWWMAAVIAGAGIAGLVVHMLDTSRAAAEPGPRAAILRPRKLSDFLHTAEIAAPAVALVLPALAIGLAVTSTGGGQANGLLVGAGVAVLATLVAALIQRSVLHLAPPADSPTRLKWEDTLRAIALRDVGITAYGISCTLGGVAAYTTATSGLVGPPYALVATTFVTLGLGLVGLVVLTVIAESTSPTHRFLHLYYDVPAEGIR